jgi:hypothetical protein
MNIAAESVATGLSSPTRGGSCKRIIAEYTDPLHDPMIPHVIVLEPGLVVYKIYNGYRFFGRPTFGSLYHDRAARFPVLWRRLPSAALQGKHWRIGRWTL